MLFSRAICTLFLTTWLLDLSPREVEPYFTASFAYSIYIKAQQFLMVGYLEDFALGVEGCAGQAVVD